MFYCLAIAIISTLLWINAWIAEYVGSVTRHYSVDEEDKKMETERAKLRTVLAIIMGVFWSAYFTL